MPVQTRAFPPLITQLLPADWLTIVQPVPSRVSVRPTPEAAPGPLFVMTMVNWASCPAVIVPLPVFSTETSGQAIVIDPEFVLSFGVLSPVELTVAGLFKVAQSAWSVWVVTLPVRDWVAGTLVNEQLSVCCCGGCVETAHEL